LIWVLPTNTKYYRNRHMSPYLIIKRHNKGKKVDLAIKPLKVQ
jgi:hypothetical protein